jgi:hypothetical protein
MRLLLLLLLSGLSAATAVIWAGCCPCQPMLLPWMSAGPSPAASQLPPIHTPCSLLPPLSCVSPTGPSPLTSLPAPSPPPPPKDALLLSPSAGQPGTPQ